MNSKDTGSLPDGALNNFYLYNTSGHTNALGLTDTLREMNIRNPSRGKGGRCLGLTTLSPFMC
jgi:hypothetical protein